MRKRERISKAFDAAFEVLEERKKRAAEKEKEEQDNALRQQGAEEFKERAITAISEAFLLAGPSDHNAAIQLAISLVTALPLTENTDD